MAACAIVCVCYFVEILGQSQPKISRHLAYCGAPALLPLAVKENGCINKIVVPKHAGGGRES